MKRTLVAALLLAALPAAAHAFETELLPDSRHQLFQPYSFFTDPQTTLLWRTPRKGWGEVGGTFAALEVTDWAWRPQLIIQGSASAAYRFNDKYDTLLTETIDARVGLAVDLAIAPDSRLEVSWTHWSGHVTDNVPDVSLLGSNSGDELIAFRLTHDIGERWRVGGTLKPIVGSEPGMKFFAADQFVEWFPWGQAADYQHASPYVSLGFEELGVDHLMFTYHLQLGLLFGNHFREKHHQSLRPVAGYYRGIDPRLKYAQFMLSRAEFGYFGLALDF
ncbi:MAG: hypothetical protein HY075_05840 [Deltaproteobacteria bacterium]|nr:hypothetical protein [Deltaproteobacteria bacterium]